MTPQNPHRARHPYDTFHMGRSGMDLYSNDVGADFVHIRSFAAYVGGSPTNMSVGCRRLGLKSALLTAFGEDPVGDFVAHFLTEEGVDIRFSPRKPGRQTSAVTRSGETALAFACDVLDAVQLRECCEAISAVWGTADLLINGAGGNDPRGSTSVEFEEPAGAGATAQSFFDLDPAGFRHVFDLNFMGTFLTTQVFSRGMVAKGKGSIINISSMGALMPLPKVAAYSAAKAAVSNFTRWLAVHFSHVGIRVNALAPGFFMTEQLRFLHIDPKTGELLPRAHQVIAHTPMGRYGRPDDLIGALVWLLSDASGFVTGVVVPVDGGFSSYSI